MILAERAARLAAEADRSSGEALIAQLKLQIEKLRRELYGSRSERKARLLDQMELELEELEAAASEDEIASQTAAARLRANAPLQRRSPSRKPFPAHCRASASSSRLPRTARAAGRPRCRSWART